MTIVCMCHVGVGVSRAGLYSMIACGGLRDVCHVVWGRR